MRYIAFFVARMVEVSERLYAIIEGFDHPTNAYFFNNVKLQLDQSEDVGERDERTQIPLCNAVKRTSNRKESLNSTRESDWKMTFNHAVEEMDFSDRERGDICSAITSH